MTRINVPKEEAKMSESTGSELDASVRRLARRVGLQVVKTRKRNDFYKQRGYMLIDSRTGACVAGPWYELTAEDVIKHCADSATIKKLEYAL